MMWKPKEKIRGASGPPLEQARGDLDGLEAPVLHEHPDNDLGVVASMEGADEVLVAKVDEGSEDQRSGHEAVRVLEVILDDAVARVLEDG
jgi:hypothetical protein